MIDHKRMICLAILLKTIGPTRNPTWTKVFVNKKPNKAHVVSAAGQFHRESIVERSLGNEAGMLHGGEVLFNFSH